MKIVLWNNGENVLYLKNSSDAEAMLNQSLKIGQALGMIAAQAEKMSLDQTVNYALERENLA